MPATATTSLESTNISDTYYGLLHAGGLPIPVTGQVRIRDGSGTQTALSLGANCNGATICGTLKADTLQGTSLSLTNKITPTQLDIEELVKALYPVNSVIYTTDNANPKTRAGWSETTWEQIAEGRFIVGVGRGTDNRGMAKDFGAGNTYGEYEHVLTIAEMPSHKHGIKLSHEAGGSHDARGWPQTDAYGGPKVFHSADQPDGSESLNNGAGNPLYSNGSGQDHNNIPPGFGMYVWKRTA